MSRVIIESQPGDALYVLENFHCSPKGQRQSWDTAVEFLPGQRVKFVSFRWNSDRDNFDRQNLQPTWMITFEHDGTHFEATQDYFLTQDAWSGLMKVFGAGQEALKKSRSLADNNNAGKTFNWDWLYIIAVIVVLAGLFWACTGFSQLHVHK